MLTQVVEFRATLGQRVRGIRRDIPSAKGSVKGVPCTSAAGCSESRCRGGAQGEVRGAASHLGERYTVIIVTVRP